VLRTGTEVTRFDHVQPVIFTVQVALARALRARGVEPAAVAGHSMGEVAAAVTAGALDLADGVRVICRRSLLCLPHVHARTGAMAAVELPAQQVTAELIEVGARVDVAVIAAPRSTVIGGVAPDVRRLVHAWNERGVPARMIAVDVASHSRLVRTAAGELRDALTGLRPRTPDVPFYTTVLSTPRDPGPFDAAYWAANLAHPVRALAVTSALVADGFRLFQEISPHPVASHPLSATFDELGATDAVALPTLRSGEDDLERLWTSIAALHCCGHPVPWERWYRDGALVDVPTTSWHRRHHLIDLRTTCTVQPEAPPLASVTEGTATGDTQRQDRSAALRTTPETERRSIVEEMVTTALRAVLRLRDRRIHPNSVFSELGLDSLLAVELRSRLEGALSVEIPLNVFWQHPTPGSLSGYLCDREPEEEFST
jgi:acyl transferase domain-containing protein